MQQLTPPSAAWSLLAGVLDLSDSDLKTLLALIDAALPEGSEDPGGTFTFWHAVRALLVAEQKRRRREIVELERLYFMR